MTFNAEWVHLYDQAGLLFTQKPRDPSVTGKPKWLKTGLEIYRGKPQLSTVGCDRFSDWGVAPLSPFTSSPGPITIAVEPAEGEYLESVWVYLISPEGEKIPLREVCWFYVGDEGQEWDLEVAAYAARPEQNVSESLVVDFSGFDVTWS